MNEAIDSIAGYVHRQILKMDEGRPVGVLKENPSETLLAVCNRIASIEVYKTKMRAPRGHIGDWPPPSVIREDEALREIAAVIGLWQAGKINTTNIGVGDLGESGPM